jgi:hypothetical protein
VKKTFYRFAFKCVRLLAVAGLTAVPGKLLAQSTAFTYQGRLTDNGAPANGAYDLQFAIYNSTNGGTALTDPITDPGLEVSNGLFTVTLDFGPGVFDGAGRWLEIAARTNGATDFIALTPRQQLTAAPTAIFAGTAATALSVSGTLPSGSLAGSYNGPINFNNPSNTYSGDGANLANIAGALPPQLQSGIAVQAVPNTSYILTNPQPVTVTLPVAPKIGDSLRVAGTGLGGWILAQNQGQSVLGQNLVNSFTPWNNLLTDSVSHGFTAASSADGVHLIVGTTTHLEISSDSGATWFVPPAQPAGAAWIATSADGRHAAAALANRLIYTSVDFGTNWTEQTNSFLAGYDGIASAADGSRLVAIANVGGIYVSPDFGTNWTLTTAPSNSWVTVASSADGSHLVAAAKTNGIYLSSNFGVTWQLSTAPVTNDWAVITSSADGTRLFAFDNSTNAWFSTDAGHSWQSSSIAAGFTYAAACSADGLRAAVASGVNIYLTTDGGLTWLKSNAPASPWRAIASSATGNFIATGTGTGIYAFRTSTSIGASGYLSGGPYSAVELQYVGNGQFLPLNHEGTLLTH